MKRYLKYFSYVFRHKWYVMLACFSEGLFIAGILHDLSKFRPSEFIPYARYFYEKDGSKKTVRDKTGYYKPTDTRNVAFEYAWNHHQKRNKHHWQYWLLQYERGERWSMQEMSIENPQILALDGKPFLILEAEDDDGINTKAYRRSITVIDALNLAPIALPMPDRYRREMLADWLGAGRAYGNPDTAGWYQDHKDGILLHPETRAWVERELFEEQKCT